MTTRKKCKAIRRDHPLFRNKVQREAPKKKSPMELFEEALDVFGSASPQGGEYIAKARATVIERAKALVAASRESAYEDFLEARERREELKRQENSHAKWTNEQQERSHACTHHCYHTYPGSYGGSRSDTYNPTQCCVCGASAPNPYENERR